MTTALTDELRSACFSAARAVFLRCPIHTVRGRDEALKHAVSAALLEALPVLTAAGAEAERKLIVERAHRLNYGPTLRRFIRDVIREHHLQVLEP
jgi:hypothetical protein